MALSAGTEIAWSTPSSKYESEKSICSARSGVIVNDETATSILPPATTWAISVSNDCGAMYSTSTPIFSPMATIRSYSKPSGSPAGVSWM